MFFRILDRLTRFLTILLMSVITLIVPIEVFLRYFFGGTLYITEHLTRYLLVWVVFLASSLALTSDSHIRIEILLNRFTGKTRLFFELISELLLLTFLVFLVIEGTIALSFQTDQIISTLGVSMFWFYLAIPVGSSLMGLNLLAKIWETLKKLSGKTEPGQNDSVTTTSEPGGLL